MTVTTNAAATGMLVPSNAVVTNPTVTASPFTYTNTSQGIQQVCTVGGTIGATAVIRSGTTVTFTAAEYHAILCPGDGFIVTYTVAPTMSVFQII